MAQNNASTATAKGVITVEGIRTVYATDGRTVTEQSVVLKETRGVKGVLSRRFLIPMSMFSVDQITEAMVKDGGKFFPENTEVTFTNVTPVNGSWRTYEAKLACVVRPLSDKVLTSLVNSQTLVKQPD